MKKITFHERSLGQNFNNFPPPGTEIQLELPDETVKAWKPFSVGDLDFSHGEEVYNCNWMAFSPKGGQCVVTIEDENGEIYI